MKTQKWMGKSTGNADKKTRQQANNKAEEEFLEKMRIKRKKATQVKQTIQFKEINQKLLTKEGRLKIGTG